MSMRPRRILAAALAIALLPLVTGVASAQQPTGAESDFFATAFTEYHDTLDTPSDGDLWPSCWGDDGNVYAANGDGKGFDLAAPFSDIVMNRIFGTPETGITGERLSAGDDIGNTWTPDQPGARYNKKPTGMVCVDGDGDGTEELYMAIQDLRIPEPGFPSFEDNPGFNDAPAASISRSDDHGETWQKTAGPMFTDHEFTTIWFLDYGQSSEHAVPELGPIDGSFVYAYGLDGNWRDSFSDTVPDPQDLYLGRVPKNRVQDRNAWTWYDGTGPGGVPLWTTDIDSKEPVLTDERRVYPTLRRTGPTDMSVLSQASTVYNAPLDRYIYTSWTEFTFEFYEAPAPWGPWKLFSRKDFGGYPWFNQAPGCPNPKNGGYSLQIPSKFISDDGKRMWVQSNWFEGGASCGGSNYNFSLRPIDVEPFVPTTAANAADPTDNIATRSSTTPIEKQAHFGNGELYNDGNPYQNEDSFDWENKPVDFWGYEWPREFNMDRVVYTTGNMFGNGGWFESDLRVQVRQDFEWVDVTGQEVTPDYPYDRTAGPNRSFTFTFDDIAGDGVRVIGAPTPGPADDGYFTSIAELEVFYDTAPDGSGGPPPQSPPPQAQQPAPSADRGGAAPVAEPIVRIKRRTLRVGRKRRTSVTVRCPRTTATRCKGTVTIMRQGGPLVGRKSFSIAPDRYQRIRMKVTRAAQRALRRRKNGRMKVSVYVLTRGADGVLRRAAAAREPTRSSPDRRLTLRLGGPVPTPND